MLDPWIIEEVRRREEEREQKEQGRRLEIPLESPFKDEPRAQPEEKSDRGVVVIDI